MFACRIRPLLLAALVSAACLSTAGAQEAPALQAPYPGVAGVESYGSAAPYPYVFLGGSRGSHHLNGNTGHGHYVYRGSIVWSYDLQKYYEDRNYVYYYETEGNVNWWRYCWAFAKHPYCQNVAVYRQFPGDHRWVFVHGAWRTIVPPNAYGAEETRVQ